MNDMQNLASVLQWLYPDARPLVDYVVRQDSEADGPYIAAWSVPGVPEPTLQYLQSREAEFLALPNRWRERRAAARMADEGHADRVLLRAALRVVLDAITQDRQYMAALRAELIALGRTLPAPPAVRTWPQLVAAVKAKIDAGEGDPPT